MYVTNASTIYAFALCLQYVTEIGAVTQTKRPIIGRMRGQYLLFVLRVSVTVDFSTFCRFRLPNPYNCGSGSTAAAGKKASLYTMNDSVSVHCSSSVETFSNAQNRIDIFMCIGTYFSSSNDRRQRIFTCYMYMIFNWFLVFSF